MRDVKWLISLYDDSCEKLAHTIKLLGYDVRLVGKCDNMENKPWWKSFDFNDCVVFMGSLQFARDFDRARGRHNWYPGAICDLDFFRYRNYSQYIGPKLLNWPYTIVTTQCFFQMKKHLYDTFGNSDCIFVRPDSGFKAFTGQVLDKQDFLRCYDLFDKYGQGLNELLIVSTPENIAGEYRLVIVEGKVVAGSAYRQHRQLETYNIFPLDNSLKKKLVEFAEEVAREIPHDVYVMDVCRLDFTGMDDVFRVVELNSFSCSGMYDCDMTKVVPAVSEWAMQQWEGRNDVWYTRDS